eukprot:CFRG6415T1
MAQLTPSLPPQRRIPYRVAFHQDSETLTAVIWVDHVREINVSTCESANAAKTDIPATCSSISSSPQRVYRSDESSIVTVSAKFKCTSSSGVNNSYQNIKDETRRKASCGQETLDDTFDVSITCPEKLREESFVCSIAEKNIVLVIYKRGRVLWDSVVVQVRDDIKKKVLLMTEPSLREGLVSVERADVWKANTNTWDKSLLSSSPIASFSSRQATWDATVSVENASQSVIITFIPPGYTH